MATRRYTKRRIVRRKKHSIGEALHEATFVLILCLLAFAIFAIMMAR
jgi:hypothetical protein